MTALRMWETPHLMALASGSESDWWVKRWTYSERIKPFGLDLFDDPQGNEAEGES